MSPMSVFLLSPPPALTLPSPFPFRHLFVAPLARRQPKPLIFPAFRSFPNHCRSITYIRSSMNVPEEELPPPTSCIPKDSLLYARGYWVTASHIAWNTDDKDESVYLFASKNANLFLTDDGVEGYDLKMQLEKDTCGLPKNVTKKFPHISSYVAYQLPKSVEVVGLIKCQVAIASFCVKGRCRKVTGLQLPGVLDDLYLYTGPLGAIFNEVASLYLWAPTAHSVCAYIFNDPLIETPVQRIQLKEYNGVWRADLPTSWEGFYYVYEVSAYHHSTLKIETCLVNDPYARGLSPDGKRTLLVNLKNEDLKPPGWDELVDEKPMLSSFNDISIYELHIRDFSVRDDTVAPSFRGGYLAFTCQDSNGMLHLKRLSEAGLSHVHLLPSYHFGGVDDLKEKWKYIDFVKLEDLPPDSDVQQAEVTAVQDEDGYNWGYNPILWGVPKGSYAYDPKGATRTLEFRKMVQALNRIGLRVILDVVYNHVHGCGPLSDVSVLDKVVPGYYLRRNTDGFTEHSTCENNTASEHFMVERLIIDDLLCWAVDYKVDGFRFDLMGHIMKSTMVKAKNALQNLAKEKDGVDGSKIYIYGEGWDFGEVANNGRGTNATQFNVSGTGIGSFNDRMRDAVLGGSPFGHPLQQGFVTGLQLQPNEHDHGDETVTKSMLAASADQIQLGLAANLRDFVLTTHQGEVMKGSEVLLFGGTPIAYASEPTETINYVSAHDNETLFDNICLKAPIQTSTDDRCRINSLATSLVVLSQGIPFFHAGDEILRSKSLDRDSYNSGDWFNRLDFTYESNNWGVGLPPKEKNEKNWPLMKPRLADPSFKPQKRHILSTLHNFETLLKIRYSSPLFRLKTATAIQERVRFHNTGPYWIPGIISMSIEDGLEGMPGITQLDPLFSCILVIFNARPTETSVTIPSLQNRSFRLHPLQLKSADCLVKKATYIPAVGSFTVPQRTTSVFVEVRNT